MRTKITVKREKVCKDCGAKFFTLYGSYCDKCRKKRLKRHTTTFKVCPKCGKTKKMYPEQIMCRKCLETLLIANDAPKSAKIAEERRKARQTGGELEKIEICPNFDGTNINCVTCEPGSWKFKDCGRKNGN